MLLVLKKLFIIIIIQLLKEKKDGIVDYRCRFDDVTAVGGHHHLGGGPIWWRHSRDVIVGHGQRSHCRQPELQITTNTIGPCELLP